MRAESVRVSFGCLLHDIGKPVLRAGGQTGDHSSLGYAYLKKLWQDDRDILDCVRLHHAAALRAAQPADSSIAWIACIADNISAAADRRSIDTEETSFRRYLPLVSVFSHMNGEHPGKAVSPVPQTGQLHLPLENMDALTAAQSLADRLYAADEREDVLRQSGFFERGDGTWHLSCGAYDLLVTLGEETYSAGTLETAEVTALENEQTIFTLPSARYVQGEVAP